MEKKRSDMWILRRGDVFVKHPRGERTKLRGDAYGDYYRAEAQKAAPAGFVVERRG